jgi:lipoprotein-anchoring transpeptidase ErfK/SrfK
MIFLLCCDKYLRKTEGGALQNYSRTSRARPVLYSMLIALAVAFLTFPASAVEAAVLARVDLSRQRMEVYIDGRRQHVWVVSTGRDGWQTPPGKYYPFGLARQYYSNQWKMNLTYLVWISRDGIAIHGTDLSGKLGRPASHGCIRLSIANAATFYGLVQSHGLENTEVIVAR